MTRLRFMSVVLFAGFACALGDAHAQQPAAMEQQGPALRRLSAREIADTMIGNTLSGTRTDGSRFLEYLEPRGILLGASKGKSDQGAYSGWWDIKGDKLCIVYREFLGHDGCWSVEVLGTEIYLADKNGRIRNADHPITILPGNGTDL
jgi:hypothetical protein